MKMKLWSRTKIPACAGLIVAGLLAACATTVHLDDPTGTVAEYKYGYLYVKPYQKIDDVHTAVKAAFKNLNYLQTGDDVTPGEIKVSATDQHDTAVSVELKDYTSYTEVKIRCGVSGDLSQEQEVYKAIERNLH